jgi:hypothetical protein
MKSALVVYESLFGDARVIANAIADGLSWRMPAYAIPVGKAPHVVGSDVGLLVVGGPNHATGMPTPSSRDGAVQQHGAHPAPEDTGLREWLIAVTTTPGTAAAAFDTRLGHPRFLKHIDHAAHTEEQLLQAHGFRIVAPAEHFFVTAASGPLVEGEESRARTWGGSLAEIAGRSMAEPIG